MVRSPHIAFHSKSCPYIARVMRVTRHGESAVFTGLPIYASAPTPMLFFGFGTIGVISQTLFS